MITDANKVFESLISKDYFFNQKNKEDLPPCFSSEKLSPVVDDILKINIQKRNFGNGKKGYDSINYRVTRHKNVPRIFNLPHPKPYIDLCSCIKGNWHNISNLLSLSRNKLAPDEDEDGVIRFVDYDKRIDNETDKIMRSIGNSYYVEVDISNFYNSIYSHSIPWALVGVEEAKKHTGRNNDKLWYNQLDKSIWMCNKNETHGIPIGPASSEIISEIILSKVDSNLSDYNYFRIVDDYYYFCKSHSEVDQFLANLSNLLFDFKLSINCNKTKIIELPFAFIEKWVCSLKNELDNHDEFDADRISNIINIALDLTDRYPSGNILKFVFKSLVNKCTPDGINLLLKYYWSLSYQFPFLLPVLKNLHDSKPDECAQFYDQNPWINDHLKELLIVNSKFRRSDIVTWLIYYSYIYNIYLNDECIELA